jgi:hypothetical protein
MANMTTVEVKAFVPAKDFDLSARRTWVLISRGLTTTWHTSGTVVQAFCCRISTTRLMPATS